ncbi:hypothetical protein PybrP1_007352 [[Pythium] brassicae (nom. inval.)]|nr:hypothetical protein PybrP1_007352 [[Pythium] brassicae (nom. inval.)]
MVASISAPDHEELVQQGAPPAKAVALTAVGAAVVDERETASRLAKLDTLLEKAGMYSNFLFSNMTTAATTAVAARDEQGEPDSAEDAEAPAAGGKRKRGRATAAKPKDGEKKLKQMQRDAKLDTRQQPPGARSACAGLAARRAFRKHELAKARRNDADFPVVITSYEVILQDAKAFNGLGFVWKYIIIDEGHRLKNMDCKLVRELKRTRWFSFTPDSSSSNTVGGGGAAGGGAVAAQDVLAGAKKAEVVSKLHEILRPFLLRRLKVDVVAEMPSKTEIFVYCPMAPLQREYYAMILNRTLRAAMEAKYGRFRSASFKTDGARNRAMQLRKCCNHPFLFDEALDGRGEVATDERLVTASGKLQVLDKMLARLQRAGHKVLIFSQMTRVLDILEDFVDLRGYRSCRLDGNTKLQDRQDQMDAFNAPQSAADDKRKLERVVIQRGHFKHQHQLRAAHESPPAALTNEELEQLLRDDVLIRDGVESGGIPDDELLRILDRDLVVKSFVTHKRGDGADSDAGAGAETAGEQLLPVKGEGYEVVESAPAASMESFA